MKCLIIGTARSGTDSLAKILSRHSYFKNKYSSEEILRCAKQMQNPSKEKIELKIKSLLNRFNLIKEIFIGTSLEKISIILKDSRNYLFSQKEILVVRIFRKNKLKQAISSELAVQTNVWHKFNNQYSLALKNLNPIPIENLEKKIRHLNFLEQELDYELNNKQHIKIEHEKFYFNGFEYQEEILKMVFQNIEVPYENNNAENYQTNQKINSIKSYNLIPNIEEINKKLSNEENGFLF